MRKGFTIIEVIVTFVILSILVFFAIYSFRYSVTNVKNASYYLPKKTMAYSALDKLLSGIYYFPVEVEKKKFVNFFQADNHNIDFVTIAPLFSKHISRSKLFYQNHTLFYTEELLYNRYTNLNNPKLSTKAKTVILFEEVSECEISYILKDGESTTSLSNQVPQGIVIKIKMKNEKYYFIFSILSNFNINKSYLYHEKYPI